MLHKSLPVEAARIKAIAAEYGTPVYIYHAATIKARCEALIGSFSGLPVSWLYAMKANDNPHVLQFIRSFGFGFDTVSAEEMMLARMIGTPPHNIFYTENNMTDEEMQLALEEAVLLNIGSFTRFERFCAHPVAKECCIRIKPDIGDGHHHRVNTGDKESKFGIQTDLIPSLLELSARSGKKIIGLHLHIGSGIRKPENLLQAAKVLIKHASAFPDLRFLNFGGGLPTPYKPDERAFDIKGFARLFGALLREDLKSRPADFRYLFEPGRWLVAEAGLLVTRVTSVKKQGDINYIGTDTGFNHLVRPAMYEAFHDIQNISREGDNFETYTISGNICESGDILGIGRKLPITAPDDLLVISDVGAYGMTMASHYNRRRLPPEVMIQEDGSLKCIRPRVSLRDSVASFLNDTRFVTPASK